MSSTDNIDAAVHEPLARMIDVSFLIGNLNKEHGGAQQLLYDICCHIAADECDLTVYYMFGEGTFQAAFEAESVDVVPLEATSNYDLGAFSRLVRLLRVNDHDILQTNSPVSGIWGRIGARIAGVPAIVSVEHNMHHTYRSLPRVTNGLTLPLANEIVGVSEAVTESFLGWERVLLAGTSTKTIVNGIDVQAVESHFSECEAVLDRQTGLNPEDLIVGSVGRLAEQKGHEYLIRAFARVHESRPEATLVLVGDGPKRESLESLAEGLSISEVTCFTGHVPEVYPLLPAFDVAVFPSLWEGLPLAPGECMAARRPVVATDIPPFRELVGDTGMLVPPRDPGALGDAVCHLIESPERRSELGQLAYERVSARFSIERTVDEYRTLYRELAGERART